MRNKFSVSFLALSLSFLGLAHFARANNISDQIRSSVTQACQSDIQKYCSDVSKNHVMACLKAHDDKLSDNCSTQWRSAKTEWQSTIKSAHAACSGDIQKFCSDSSSLKDEMSCLSGHSGDLSPACKSFRQSHNMQG